MKFSVWPSFERSWDEVLGLAVWAEQTGWHGLWYADHLMPQTPDDSPSDGMALECWSVLAGLAASVPRLTLTSVVSPLTIHDPVVLAKRAATVRHISGGRAVLGVGAGWQVNEHAAYDIELPPPGERVRRFEDGLRRMRALLHGTADAPFNPAGDGLPLMVGTGGERMMAVTARHADRWNTWGTPEEYRRRSALFDSIAEREGRDPATVSRCAQALVFLIDDPAAADKVRAKAAADRAIVGSAAQLVDTLGGYIDAGLDEFGVYDGTLGATAEQRLDTYARLHAEVFSALA
jgi:alkanesulfonate monooxygenase SsuD/methylene tetrahydromethanopterin reductase-like flavin-dependent oxidoreductase (luciferase family)